MLLQELGKLCQLFFQQFKALGKKEGERFFYITAKTITRTVAEKTLNILVERGLDIRCVFLTAKEKICFKEECNCNKDYCEFASGYYDRINEVLYEILENELIINKSVIEFYAKKFEVCPFELSLDLSLYTEGVICDYNYIFDPRVSLKRMSNLTEDRILLIDEAHNLVDRTRDMFSAVLEKEKIMSLRRKIKNEKTLYKRLSSINQEFLNFKKLFDENNDEITIEIPEKLMYSIQKFLEEADSWLKINGNDSRYKEFLELYFDFSSYIRIARVYDENFTTILTRNNKNIFIKLYCLNPSELIKYITLQNRSTVFFSATLLPHPYFRNIFGEHENDRSLILTSPFNPENLKVSIFPVSTRYRDRKKTSKDISSKIYEFVNRKTGNYLIFFPSYAYMAYIYDEILEFHEDFYADVQTKNMDELEREQYLEKFVFNPASSRIGFVTLGGIFSEGIDLIGNRLSGVVIVGVGIPKVCFERELIKEFYNNQGMFGYDYSYTFPGMNKVLQGAGRLIRTENDFGELLLIGDRYLSRKYREMVPEDWKIKVI